MNLLKAGDTKRAKHSLAPRYSRSNEGHNMSKQRHIQDIYKVETRLISQGKVHSGDQERPPAEGADLAKS